MNAGIEHPTEKRLDERAINRRKLILGRPSISFSRTPYRSSRRRLREKRETTPPRRSNNEQKAAVPDDESMTGRLPIQI